MKQRTKKNGNLNDDWETPQYILQWVRSTFGVFFDPCPLNHKFDGLKISWKKINFINPPYSVKLKTAFIKKAIFESSQGKTCIVLIPANTETKLFGEIWQYASQIFFIQKRIKFKGFNTFGRYVTSKSGQTGSMIVIFTKRRGNPVCDILFQKELMVH